MRKEILKYAQKGDNATAKIMCEEIVRKRAERSVNMATAAQLS